MYSSLEDVEFLARSSSRVTVLDAIAEEPRTRYELRELTGTSRFTVNRIVADLEDRGWIVHESGRCEATPQGRFVAREFSRLLGAELVNSLGLPERHLDAIAAEDDDEFTDRQLAVVEFARQGARDPKRITEDHVADLRAVGFDHADVLELVTVVAQANFANTIADALNVHPGDQSGDLERYLPWETTEGTLEATDGA